MSTGNTCAPADSAIRQTQLSPLVKLEVTTAVTSFPVWLIPSSTIPLSAHRMTTAFFPKSTCQVPKIPAADAMASSSTPKLLRGFATLSQRFQASLSAALSGGTIPSSRFSSCCLVKLFPVLHSASLFMYASLYVLLYHLCIVSRCRFLPPSVFSAGFPQPLSQPRFIGRIVEMGKSRQKPFFLHHTAPASV